MGGPLHRYFEGLLLLLVTAGFFTLASTGRLAWPVVVVAASCYGLRLVAFARRRMLAVPNRIWMAGLLLYLPVCAADAWFWSGSGVQAALHLVVLAGAARLLAPYSSRDGILLGLLAFLEVLTAALLTVSGIFFLLFLLFLVLLVATLVAQEMARGESQSQAGGGLPLRPLFRFSLGLSAAVAVCSVVVFFLLPRTALGVWAARPSLRGLTGFSDDVRLGAIASLQRSDTPVMHIRMLDSDPPLTPEAFEQVPWRGRGLTHFDGQRWTSSSAPALYSTQDGRLEVSRFAPRPPAEMVRYQVTLEPMSSPVLFFPAQLLRASTRFPVLAWDRATATLATLGADFTGTSYSGISDLARPQVEALRTAPRSSVRFRFGFDDFLQLPDGLDPRIAALARSITLHTAPDDWDRMQALSAYLQDHYEYTLDDLPQGADPLATFLFDRPAGDCEYFATALAVMARTLGIPTRVVNGFLVDSYNPISGEYIVRGRDAHSWVEAYFPARADATGRRAGAGTWVSFDATPPAPASAGADWGSAGMLMDALSSVWQEWIVNYDTLRQARLAGHVEDSVGGGALRAWERGSDGIQAAWQALGGLAPAWRRLAGWGAAALVLVLTAGAGLAVWGRRQHWWRRTGRGDVVAVRQAQRANRRFERLLARSGFVRAPAQTSEELLGAVAQRDPHSPLLAAATAFVDAYQHTRFGGAASGAGLGPLLTAVRRSRHSKLH